MKKDFFMEMTVEEIPATMAPEIARSLCENFENKFRELSVGFEKILCLHTPRRLALMVGGVETRQKDTVVENFGPSEASAFSENGSPTPAALGFARGKGARVEDLEIVEREKGRFLAFRQKIKGKESGQIISQNISSIIAGVRCPKSMRWQRASAAFARPVRKVSCFYGGEPLAMEMEGVPFSTTVSGHRFAGGEPFKPAGWETYLEGLRKNFVIADPDERLKIIEKKVRSETEKLGGVFRQDNELLSSVNGLVEYPVVLSGRFEKQFLNLPEEVLTSVMKKHQKYFPVFSATGEIMPYFVFVCGTPVKTPETVIRGNERVLRARFTDAEFFHTEDLKKPLESNLGELESTIFLSGLGSYGDKTARLEKTADRVARLCGQKGLKKLKRAATLSKADLVTQMVFEIPELQGVMGRHYSEAVGEDKEVCAAIEEQYMPTARDSVLPQTDTGALLAIADKMDNICACFYLGMKPTGSSDPHALRRQAIGLIRITLEKNLKFSVPQLADFCLKFMEKGSYSVPPYTDTNLIRGEITDFIAGRFRGIMTERGAKPDSLEAVISARFDSVTDCRARLDALENSRKSRSFGALAVSFKRVVNILGDSARGKVDETLFEGAAEKNLWKALVQIEKLPQPSDYGAYLKLLESLGKPVDDFFESTMVMHKNARIRKNRAALLGGIKDLFFKVGDLSKIETAKAGQNPQPRDNV